MKKKSCIILLLLVIISTIYPISNSRGEFDYEEYLPYMQEELDMIFTILDEMMTYYIIEDNDINKEKIYNDFSNIDIHLLTYLDYVENNSDDLKKDGVYELSDSLDFMKKPIENIIEKNKQYIDYVNNYNLLKDDLAMIFEDTNSMIIGLDYELASYTSDLEDYISSARESMS